MSHGVVRLTTSLADPDVKAEPRVLYGSGVISGIGSGQFTLLTATHLVSPAGDLRHVVLEFASLAPIRLDVSADTLSIVDLGPDLVAVTISVPRPTSDRLREKVPHFRIGSSEQALSQSASPRLIGRCTTDVLRTFPVKPMFRAPDSEVTFLEDRDIVPGCSGSAVFADGALLGVVQRTSGQLAEISLIEPALAELRKQQPLALELRNWIEPFGIVAFRKLPVGALYAVNGGSWEELEHENAVLKGPVAFEVRDDRLHETASAQLRVGDGERIDCEARFAHRVSRFRARYRYVLIGAGLVVGAVGGLLLYGSERRRDDFDASWDRADLDAHRRWFRAGWGVLGTGAVITAGAIAFGVAGPAQARSELVCE